MAVYNHRQLQETAEPVSTVTWVLIAVGIVVVPCAIVALACAIERKYGKPQKKQMQAVSMNFPAAQKK